jgi:hypothetical protein
MKVNHHSSHPSAFISSTFIDLQEERASVAETLSEYGLLVNALDVKPATNNSSKSEILRGIKESDFVILLIGDRYGSIVPTITDSSSRSVTWWEYQKALGLGKPVIPFFHNKDYFDIDNHDNKTGKQYAHKRKLFERFKSIITNKSTPAYFDDGHDLSEKIRKCIIPTYRSGVELMNRKNSTLTQTVSRLEAENSELQRKLDATVKVKENQFMGGILGGLGNLSK